MSDLKRLREKREEILKAELAAWLHDVGKTDINEDDLPENLRQWLKASDPSSVHPWKEPLGLWLLAQCHGIAHFEKQEPDKKFESMHIDSPFGYPVQISKSSKEQIKKWFSNLNHKDAAKGVLSLYRADSRYPINEVDLWAWGETTSALVKGAWLQAILLNIPLTKPNLDFALLEALQQRIESLIQREDSPKELLEQLQNKLPGSSFKNLQLSGKEESNPLHDLVRDLHQWLNKASNIKFQNRLTQKQWEEFLEKLSKLLQWLRKVSLLLQWRLLSIRTNGLDYLLSAPSIPDLKARQELLQDAWNKVQTLLEEEYPLALEVYRDENGPVFVVPDKENLLGLTDSERNAKTLREIILERFRQGTIHNDPCLAIQGEIVPTFKLDPNPWKGQPAPQELPPIGKHIGDDVTPPLKSDPQWVAAQWCNLPRPQERCTVCGLRPQGPSRKARDRKMCDICERRRGDRAKAWAANIGRAMTTIWLDEVADRNGRIGLLAGTFGLSHWLNGTLVHSLAVRTPNDQNGHTAEEVAKNPSFARLRRIWETTRKFWEETLEEAEGRLDKRPRIFLKGTVEPKNRIFPYHAYELEVLGRKVAVLWVPENAEGVPEEYQGGFWVIENLEYLKSDQVFGRDLQEILKEGSEYKVYEPTEYGRPGREQAIFTLHQIHSAPHPYSPLIPILAEPRTFMALVPANKAFEVVKAIKAKYEREMGKVRNRLPLHLGVVFADAHQPLRIILDAGRRMLKQKAKPIIWKVSCPARKQVKKDDTLPDRFEADQEGQFKEWVEILLKAGRRKLTWFVPAVMGDGQTEDHWYPYVFWVRDVRGNYNPLSATIPRERCYQTFNPFFNNPKAYPAWLVHAAELESGDIVYFTPATFDFIWLDHPGSRFRIAYDDQGQRLGTLRRPYLLDELEDLETCWRLLAGDEEKGIRRLSSRQLHQVRDLIEGKRSEWFVRPEDSVDDPTFRQFCEDVLLNAEWTTRPEEKEFKRLTHWAVTGLLADAVELFYHIMKERALKDQQND